MTKVLRDAIARVEALPVSEQDRIARELIDYLDKLSALRADLESGIRQLDAGEGRELDADAFLRRMHEQHRKG
jgi:Arc/MetJ-type ribon-helix-helix transcriptional regulator